MISQTTEKFIVSFKLLLKKYNIKIERRKYSIFKVFQKFTFFHKFCNILNIANLSKSESYENLVISLVVFIGSIVDIS